MTWKEANLSLQLIAEAEVGAPARLRVNRINAEQDAAADALRSAL